ncbi:MAG: C69 family dipeptidase [Acidobacteria bacterium]|nr:C69 family dipeptidase [Acidobacteriota bacterium]
MCDTFVAVSSATVGGAVVFGKNSDREPDEAQALEYHPPRKYQKGTDLRATYISIPQAQKTHGALLCRPFWMWGSEIGANDKGVVIGNEAVWTKMPLSKKGGLTGMDLLRLALERGGTAQDALQVIVQLLADFGQGGICGYRDKKMAYHNSYIIADPDEAWVLETAAHLWAAKKVTDFASISNGLTIGEEFDLNHPALISTAKDKGWMKKGETFHFARHMGDWFFTTFSASRRRQSRSLSLLENSAGTMDIPKALRILRDHGEPEGDNSYRPDHHFLGNRICAHAANPISRKATQSTASLAARLTKSVQTFWVTGTSAPCTGVFKPVWFDGDVLPDIGPAPGDNFDPETLWWRHERLHRAVLLDFQHRIAAISEERDELEARFLQDAAQLEGTPPSPDSTAVGTVKPRKGQILKSLLTEKAFRESDTAESRWLENIRSLPVRNKLGFIYRRFWNGQNQKAGFPDADFA